MERKKPGREQERLEIEQIRPEQGTLCSKQVGDEGAGEAVQ